MTIQKILNQAKANMPNIMVVGDTMLDQMIWTDVNRISPEAPVPVCKVSDTTYTLGGAGNVVNNLTEYGARISVAAIIGTDHTGDQIKKQLTQQKVDTSLLLEKKGFPSILKARVVAKNQQLCRIDYEDTHQDLTQQQSIIEQTIKDSIHSYDALILSDYGKGLISAPFSNNIIQLANKHHVPVIVDPKGRDATKYSGATYMTPNTPEFLTFCKTESLGSESNIESLAQAFIAQHDIGTLVLTRSEHGVSIITDTKKMDFPTKAKAVADITGAGDTVVAAFAFAIATGAPIEQSIQFANTAAGIVVSKVGTAVATIDEIIDYE